MLLSKKNAIEFNMHFVVHNNRLLNQIKFHLMYHQMYKPDDKWYIMVATI